VGLAADLPEQLPGIQYLSWNCHQTVIAGVKGLHHDLGFHMNE
jgi:hypothetical protein